jgi:sugar O-acyltransferase (sialic acid O-acetyltransferase NeuD family)
MRVAIFGASGHGKVVWDILTAAGHTVVGFADDGDKGPDLLGLPVARSLDDLPAHDAVIVGIGNNHHRKAKFEALKADGRRFINAIHPSAVLAQRLAMGEGVVVAAGVIVNVDSRMGDNVILNTGATLDHDSQVAAHVHVAPGCHLAGNVMLGEGAFLGIGTCAIPGIQVGAWSASGAGSVLVRDVPAETTVLGVPARPR